MALQPVTRNNLKKLFRRASLSSAQGQTLQQLQLGGHTSTHLAQAIAGADGGRQRVAEAARETLTGTSRTPRPCAALPSVGSCSSGEVASNAESASGCHSGSGAVGAMCATSHRQMVRKASAPARQKRGPRSHRVLLQLTSTDLQCTALLQCPHSLRFWMHICMRLVAASFGQARGGH